MGILVHGWGSITNISFYSFLSFSTLKSVQCYPTMTKVNWNSFSLNVRQDCGAPVRPLRFRASGVSRTLSAPLCGTGVGIQKPYEF